MSGKTYELEGCGIFVTIPEELPLEFDSGNSSAQVFTFGNGDCSISFVVQNKRCTQEENSENLSECMKECQMNTSTAENGTLYSLNASGTYVVGQHLQNAEVNVVAAVVASYFTEQTLLVAATFTCDVSLIGQILGSVAFESMENFHVFKEHDVIVSFPAELKLKQDEEESGDCYAAFNSDETLCAIHYTVDNRIYSEKDIAEDCPGLLKKMKADLSTIERSESPTVNGHSIIYAGFREDSRDVQVMVAVVTSSVSEQSVIVMATFACEPVLVGKAVGAVTFNK